MVKKALGPEAIILARRDRVGPDGERQIEITAATDNDGELDLKRPAELLAAGEPPSGIRNPTALAMEELASEVSEIKRALRQFASGRRRRSVAKLGGVWLDFYDQLCARGILPHIACDLVLRGALTREMPDASVPERISAGIARSIRLGGETGGITVMLGPTGSGKTTTVAKLAARLCGRRKVGLLMADSYRVGASEQLGGYARLLDLPMEIVSSSEEMNRAVGKLGNCEEILIDTPGLSGSPDEVDGISRLLSSIPPSSRKLVWVVSATSEVRVLDRARRAVGTIPLDFCIATKVDEAGGLAQVYNWLWNTRIPLTHLATGQKVPDDLEQATSSTVMRWMLGHDRSFSHHRYT